MSQQTKEYSEALDVVATRMDELTNYLCSKKRKCEELETLVKETKLAHIKACAALTDEKIKYVEECAHEIEEHKLLDVLTTVLELPLYTYYIILSNNCFEDNQKLLRWLQNKPSAAEWESDIQIGIPDGIRKQLSDKYRFVKGWMNLEVGIDRTSHNEDCDREYSIEHVNYVNIQNSDGSLVNIKNSEYRLHDDLFSQDTLDCMLDDPMLCREFDCDGYNTDFCVNVIAIRRCQE